MNLILKMIQFPTIVMLPSAKKATSIKLSTVGAITTSERLSH